LSISKLSKKYELNFCVGHPIGGREKSGFKHSDINILKGVCHILTGPKGQLFDALWQLHESIGMKLIYMDPSMHDEIFGIVSHLPHLIAFSLVETVSKVNEDALDYAGAGFKDFTRIAGSSDIMWSNIFLDNRDNLLLLIDNYVDNLKSWRDLINKSKIKDLREKISKVSNKRRILK
jgi:prephenate dehydrogenase